MAHINLMKAADPEFLGGCETLLRLMRLNIANLHAIEININIQRSFWTDKLGNEWITFKVYIFLRLLQDSSDPEDQDLRDEAGNPRIYSSKAAYSWDCSLENTDKMVLDDVLEGIRNQSKIMYNGFGEERTEEDRDWVKDALTTNVSGYQAMAKKATSKDAGLGFGL